MGVDHRRAHVILSEQFMNRSNIVAVSVVEKDKTRDPMDIGFFGSVTLVARADCLTDLFEQLGFPPCIEITGVGGLPAYPIGFRRNTLVFAMVSRLSLRISSTVSQMILTGFQESFSAARPGNR